MRLSTRTLLAAALSAVFALSGCSIGTPKVASEDVAEQIKTQLTKQVGQEPDKVTCPDDLEGKVGATMTCTLTAGETKLGVNVKVTKVEEENVAFDIEVDDKPQS